MSPELICMALMYYAAGLLVAILLMREDDLWNEDVTEHGLIVVLFVFAVILVWPLTWLSMMLVHLAPWRSRMVPRGSR